ncbi:MAG: hypothetical protein OXE96_16320 [Gemmatimonadetes bacterium]|nr:hypothetical protein [Gemmatimonadota bacterium]
MADERLAVPTVEGRCTECWGNVRQPDCEGGEVTVIECGLCANRLAGREAANEWKEIEQELARNLAKVSLGRPAKYRPDAKFVAKIIPDMPRDKAGMDARIRAALKLPSREHRVRWLTRYNVPAGEAGYLYLQGKLLAAAARSLPRETAINRWDEVELAGPVKWQIERLDETGIHISTEAEGVPRTAPATWSERAGVLLMRTLTAAFSCEVALKAILMTRNNRARMTHDLRALYDDLPEDSRARMRGDDAAIGDVLRESREIFGDWRYFENSASMKEAAERGLHYERVSDLERAARVIIDECAMAGLTGGLTPTGHAAWTAKFGENPAITGFRETMHFRAESGESAIVWPKSHGNA